MTKTFSDLYQLATDCMEDNEPAVIDRHKRAGEQAERAAPYPANSHGQSWHRHEEARNLLAAVQLHGYQADASLTTAELLLTAAIIAARANGEELRLGTLPEVGDLAAVGRAVELARQFMDDWHEDAKNLDEHERGDLERAELEVAAAEAVIDRLEAPQLATEADAEPCYTPPAELPARLWRVRFYKEEATVERFSITVRANDAEEARQRVKAWGEGEIELTDEEEESEHYERQVDTVESSFSQLEKAGDRYAAVEVDEDGEEVAAAA